MTITAAAAGPSRAVILRRAGQLAAALLRATARREIEAGTRFLDELLICLASLDVHATRLSRTAAGPAVPSPRAATGHGLTVREMEVLRRLSYGRSNGQIAVDLSIGEETVKTHTVRVYRKLGASDRAHAVAIAFRQGLLD